MAPEQGPDSKTESCGKTTNATTNGSGAVPKSYHQSSREQSCTLQTDTVGWIYLLRKEKLIEVCNQNGIVTEGVTVDQLRRSLGDLIRKKRERASSENLLMSLEEELLAEERRPVNKDFSIEHTLRIPCKDQNMSNYAPSDSEVMATIRRWDLTYEGDEHLMEFIERLEELAECYSFTRSRLLFALLEILKGRALQWYRLKRSEIPTWEVFKEQAIRFFLPKRHLAHLEDSIYHRKQGPREKAKDYIMTLMTLIRQHPELRKFDHTDRIYDGLRCEYRLYVRRNDFRSVDELMELTDEYELLRREEEKQGKPQPSHYMRAMQDSFPYDPLLTCWRCKNRGHYRARCTYPRRLFCSRCGKDDVYSRDCMCASINEELRNDGRYYISVTVNNLPVRALVDTGSTLTYLSENVRQHLERSHIRPRTQHRSVQLANGSCIEGMSVYPISVLCNGRPTQLLASALSTLAEPLILGMDFLRRRQVRLTIDGVQLNTAVVQKSSPPPLHAVTTTTKTTLVVDQKPCLARNNTRTIINQKDEAVKPPPTPIASEKNRKYLRQTSMPKKAKNFTAPYKDREEKKPKICKPSNVSVNAVNTALLSNITKNASNKFIKTIWRNRQKAFLCVFPRPYFTSPLPLTLFCEQVHEEMRDLNIVKTVNDTARLSRS